MRLRNVALTLLLSGSLLSVAEEQHAENRAVAGTASNPPVRVLPIRVQPGFQNQVALILQEFGIIRLLGPVGTVKPAVDKARADILAVLVEQKIIPADTPGAKSETLTDATRVRVLATLQALNVAGFSVTGGTGTGTTGGGGATPPGTITSAELADGAVTTPKLANNAVTSAKIGSQAASAGMIMTADGSGGANWQAFLTGSVTSINTGAGLQGGPITTTGTISIANGGVTNAMLAPGGVSGGPAGVIQDGSIAAVDLAPGIVDLSGALVSNTLPVNRGGTGAASLTANGVVFGSGAAPLQATAVSTNAGDVLMTPIAGGAPSFGLLTDTNVSATAGIAGSKVSPNFAAQNVTTSGDISTTGAGAITSAGPLTAAQGTSGLVLGSGANASTLSSTATSPRTFDLPDNSGTIALLSDIDGGSITGTVGVPNGGTGVNSLTSNGVMVGNGVGNVQVTNASTQAGEVLMTPVAGGAPSFGLVTDSNVAATAAIAGTKVNPNFGAQPVQTSGDITTTTGTLTAGRAGSGLVLGTGANATTFSSTATAARAISFPNSSGTVSLLTDITTTNLTGTLPVNKGGTGQVTFTTNGVLFGNAAGNLNVTAASTAAGQVLQTTASGGAPTFALIANANVSATAAVDGAKINPNFAAQNITTTGNISATGAASTLTVRGPSNQLVLGAAGSQTTISALAQTANRTLSVPVLTANDTISTLGLAQTVTGVKTFSANNVHSGTNTFSGNNNSFSGTGNTFANALAIRPVNNQLVLNVAGAQTTINAPAQGANRTLSIPVLTANDTVATIGLAQTFSGANTFSGTNTFSGNNNAFNGTGNFFANALSVRPANNQLVLGAAGSTTTINAPPQAAARTLSIPALTPAADTLSTLGTAQTYTAAKTFSTTLTVSAATNQIVLGAGNTTTITSPAPAASRTMTVPANGGSGSLAISSGTGFENLRLMRGTVNTTGAGSIVAGGGFTITRNAAGDITINFSTAFSTVPSATATSQNAAGATSTVQITAVATNSVRLLRLNGGAATDGIIHFIVMGPP
ncbi:MAG TPA: hypothetical protein VEJ63_17955 [Planctomycetota bacterium]|nr:hypothetical protein [Planctomycetota bacterium]